MVAKRFWRHILRSTALIVALLLAIYGLTPVKAHADSTAGVFVATQGRVVDTRSGLGGYSTAQAAGETRTFQITGQAGVPTSGVTAVSVTLTAVHASGAGWLSARASGAGTPTGTALSYNAGETLSNTAMLPVGSDGKIAILANQASTDLLIDVQGYFKPGESTQTGGFSPVNSFRLADTRTGLGVATGQVSNGSKIAVKATGVGGIPANATAVYASITVTNQTNAGHVVPFADGAPQPAGGSLNFDATYSQALASMIPLGSNGMFDVLVSTGGPVDLVIDIEGYSSSSNASDPSVFNPVSSRLYDTRTSPNVTLAPNSVTQVTIAGVGGIPTTDDGTDAVAVNISTINASGTTSGYLRMWPSWADEPATSTINYNTANPTRSALAIIAPSADGTINISNHSSGPVDVTLDAEGWFLGVKTGIDPTVADPANAPTDTTDAPETVSGPAVVSGRFTNGAGQGLGGLSVALAATDGAPDDGTDHTPPAIGTAHTATDGTWTYTLPDPLPANLQALADANGGVLNVTATATGLATDGTNMLAVDNIPAGVANGSATTPLSAAVRADAAPNTRALHPVAGTDATPPSEQVAATSFASTQLLNNPDDDTAETTLPAWQTNDGSISSTYNPDMVGGRDYSTVTPDDNICYSHSKVLKSHIYYTAVNETHAYWNASSWDVYNGGMSSSVAAAVSSNGSNWSLGGSIAQGGSTGFGIMSRKVPSYTARQFDLPLNYQYKKYWYTCQHGSIPSYYAIEAHGYRNPSGGAIWKWGHSVASKDGGSHYYQSPSNRRGMIPYGSQFTLHRGRSTTLSIAASAFGVGVTANTSFNSDHDEVIHAGSYRSYKHLIWGAKDVLYGHPGMVYSY